MSEQSSGTGATEIWKVRVEKNSGADTYRVIRINDVGVRLGAAPQGPWVSGGYYCFGSKEIAEAYAQYVATSRGYKLCAFAFSEDDAWVELSSNPCQLNSPTPAKGVAVVEAHPDDKTAVRIAREGKFLSLGAMEFYGTSSGGYYPFKLKDLDIAEAIAAAINAREAKKAQSEAWRKLSEQQQFVRECLADSNLGDKPSLADTAHWHNDLGGNRKIPVSNDSLANSIADFAYALGRAANELARRTWGAK